MSNLRLRRSLRSTIKHSTHESTGSLCMKVESAEDEMEVEEVIEEGPQLPPVDVQRLCRMCAQPCTKSTSTSLLEPNPTLTFQLLHYFGIMMLPNDDMPTRVCHVCTNELTRWEELKNSVKKSQTYLKQQIESNKKRQQCDSDLEMFDEDLDNENIINYDISDTENITKSPEIDNTIVNYDSDNDSEPILTTIEKPINKKIKISQINPSYKNYYNCKYCEYKSGKFYELLNHVSEKHEVANELDNTDYFLKLSRKNSHDCLRKRKTRDFSPTNPFRCGICPLKYNSHEHLAIHLQKHCSANKYIGLLPCPYCGITTKRISILITHISKHVETPNTSISYKCDICDKEFDKILNLKLHIDLHLDNKKFSCSYCKKEFKHKCQLSVHMAIHRSADNIETSDNAPTCGICLQFFDTYDDVYNHVKDQHETIDSSVFMCGNCKCRYKEQESLLAHIEYAHIMEKETSIGDDNVAKCITCEICLKVFDDKVAYAQHIKKNHKNKLIHDCSYCKKVYTTLQDLKNHIHEVHKDTLEAKNKLVLSKKIPVHSLPRSKKSRYRYKNPIPTNYVYESQIIKHENGYPCGICQTKFNDAASFVEHCQSELDSLSNKILPCGFCGAKYRKIQNLLTHIEKHILNPNKILSLQCNICSQRFNSKTNLNTHMKVHSDIRNYVCKLCNNNYKYKLSWKCHIESAHKDYTGTLEEALLIENVNSNANKLKASTKVPVEKTPSEEHYSCDICNTRYFYSHELLTHYNEKHYVENDMICALCSSIYGTSEELLNHYTVHSKKRKHFCPVCGKGFKERQMMTAHIYLHSVDRTFQCDKCVRSYRARTSLIFHQKRDHGDGKELEFMCEYCSKTFSTKAQVKRHINTIHIGIKLFNCNVCNRAFPNAVQLRDHGYTHTNIKPHHCLKCNKGFISKKHWRNHMRKICHVPEHDIPYVRPRFFKSVYAYDD